MLLDKVWSGVVDDQRTLSFVEEIAAAYQISDLRPQIDACKAAGRRAELRVGVLGRFKAGKSTFLNDLVGRSILPVGVIPVTAVVTELAAGVSDAAQVRYLDGAVSAVSPANISQYITESENPGNAKHVECVSIQVPELSRFRGLRLFDTPGLESVFTHNTEASEKWAPSLDVALVTVAVDPPLSRQDIDLIRKLFRYTPRVALLLTKFDLISTAEQDEVLEFVRQQLARNFEEPIEIYPYSTRPGFEHLRAAFENGFIRRLQTNLTAERRAIVERKLQSLVRECGDYLRVSLKSAELLDAERERLREAAVIEKNALDDTRLELRLIAGNAAGRCRTLIERTFATEESRIRRELLDELSVSQNSFPRRLDAMIDAFQSWLAGALSAQLKRLSAIKRKELMQPAGDVQRQFVRILQGFRDRVSERILELYGVPLRTVETEISIEPPKSPDVHIGRVFDHNWELLSPVLPMSIFRGPARRKFRRKVGDETFKNLSRLTSQWEQILRSAISSLLQEAERRIGDLVSTVEKLTANAPADARRIQADLGRLERLFDEMFRKRAADQARSKA